MGPAAWELSPGQVVWRIADLNDRDIEKNRLAAVVSRSSQYTNEGFAEFVEALGGGK